MQEVGKEECGGVGKETDKWDYEERWKQTKC